MKFAVENYVSQVSVAAQRLSIFVWGVATLLAILWLVLIGAAPLLKANGWTAAANAIYVFFSYLCHQASARSYHLDHEPLAVCARCLGVYTGLSAGMLVYPFVRSLQNVDPLPRIWLLLAPVPTTIDFLLGAFGVWENTHFSRFSTAIILGVGCAFFLTPGLIEISRYFLVSSER